VRVCVREREEEPVEGGARQDALFEVRDALGERKIDK